MSTILLKRLKIIFFKISLLVGLLVFISNLTFGQTRTATNSGNWNSTTTWGGQSVPTSLNDVIINSGVTVTVTANAACNSLILENPRNSGITELIINQGIALNVGSASGSISIGSGASMSNGSISNTNLIVNGNLFSGTIDHDPGIRGVGQGGSGNTNLIINSTGTVTSTGNITGANILQNGFQANASVIINSTGTLKLTGTFTTSEFTNSSSSTVEYNGGDQTIRNATYGNLILSGNGTKSLPALPDIAGDFRILGSASTTTSGNLNVKGNLTIGNGGSLTTGSNFTFSVSGNTQIGEGVSGNFSLGGTGAKTFTGSVTINTGATWNEAGTGPINMSSDLTNNGVFTANSGTHTFSGTNRTLGGSSPISISNISISGTYTNNANLTTSNLTGSGTLTQGTNSTLNLTGGNTITGFIANTNCPNTVNYSGASQTVRSINYCNLSLSGSGTKTLQTGTTTISGNLTLSGNATTTSVIGLTISGNITISSGTTFSAGSFTHNIGGNWTNSGTFNQGTSTINFNGTNAASIGASNFQNVTFSGSGAKTATGTLSIAGNVNITNNFTAGAFTHTVGGNWANTGTFTSTGSTIDFNGASAASIGTSNFQNVTFSGSGAKTATGAFSIDGNVNITNNFTAGAFTHTVGGNWTRSGTFTSTGSTIDFNGASAASIGTSNFQNVTFSGSGVKTATGTLSIAGNVNITNNFTAGAFTHTVGGNWANTGTFTSTGSTIDFNGAATASIGTSNFQNVTFSGSGTKTANGNLTIFGNLLISNNFSGSSFVHTITGNFTNTGTFVPGTSSMVFSNAGNQNISSSIFYKIQLQGSGNKFFLVSTTVTELMDIEGSAIVRLGSQNHSTQKLFISGNGQQAGTYGSSASSATFKLASYFGTTDTGILDVLTNSFSCSTGTWLGTTNSDWNTASNWCNGIIPTSTTDVTIPAGAINQPIIGTGGGLVRNIHVASGANLQITGANILEVYGNWLLSGTFNPGSSSTVEFKGASNNSIGSGTFANLVISGSGSKTINSTLLVSENISVTSTVSVILTSPNSLTVNSGKNFEIGSSSTFQTNGTTSKIILAPGSNFLNRSTSNPRLEILRTFTGTKGWRMFGSPINSTYAALTAGMETQGFPGSTNPSLQPNLLWWDETDKGTSLQAWRQPSNLSNSVPVGRGHYFYLFNGASKPGGGNYTDVLPKNIQVTGTEVNLATGTFNFGITFTPRDTNLVAQADTLIEVNRADEGFNLVANPTASNLDWNAASGWTKTNVDATIYVWDPATSSFLTWNGTVGSLGNGRIAPFQAFWVRANAPSPSLLLTGNGAKTLNNTSFYGRMSTEENPFIHLRVIGENLSSESFISFGPDGKEGVDPKDAFQLESLAEDWLLLYTYGSLKTKTPLVINHLDELGKSEKIIPLHLAASKGGNPIKGSYLMEWSLPANLPADISIVLMDHISQKAIDMRKETAYSFQFEAPKIPNARVGKSNDPFGLPKAVVFESPYENGEVIPNAKKISEKPQRPFTLFISSSVGSEIGYLPDLPKLFAPAPNPFSTQTRIRFYLPVAQQAEVQILNLNGQVVGRFDSQFYESGIHDLNWIPSGIELPNGLYVVRLSTNEYQMSQKLIKN